MTYVQKRSRSAIGLAVRVAGPLVLYLLVQRVFHAPQRIAMMVAGIPSALGGMFEMIRRKRVEFVTIAYLVTTALTAVVVFALGGSPKLYLVHTSFLTAAYGLAMLASLCFPRPLGFYAARTLCTRSVPERAAAFEALWRRDLFRRRLRVLTMAGGFGLLGESAARFALVLALPIPQYLIASHGVTVVFMGAAILWVIQCTGAIQEAESMK